jgi:hypothetical protein
MRMAYAAPMHYCWYLQQLDKSFAAVYDSFYMFTRGQMGFLHRILFCIKVNIPPPFFITPSSRESAAALTVAGLFSLPTSR